MKSYKGKFSNLKNPEKYAGDPNDITYRSHWERNVMRWMDENETIVEWSSEEIHFPYTHPIRGGSAKYYPDFFFKVSNGELFCIEVKPKKQTRRPEKPSRTTRKYLDEMATYVINQEKWDTARKYCKKHDIKFQIWTEEELENMGILKWETSKTVLREEGALQKKPKLKSMIKRRRVTRPKRKS